MSLVSRDRIGQAKGILMERYKISGERAFLLLTRVSQHSNRKLNEVAEELVRTGTIHRGSRTWRSQISPRAPITMYASRPGIP